MKIVLVSLVFLSCINAQVLVMIDTAMKSSFGSDIEMLRKNILLKKDEAKELQNLAQAKIDSKIFRVYLAKKDSQVLGYGVFVSQKVRSKNAAVLYALTKEGVLKNIEIIAFNEPLEYLPSQKWKEQFNNTDANSALKVGNTIATISGATLSARVITDASRVALALYEIKLKDL